MSAAKKLRTMPPQAVAKAMRDLVAELDGKIMLAHVLVLHYLADQVEAMAKEPA